MPAPTPLLDRAYEIARAGVAKCLQDVRLQLRREGYPYIDILRELQGNARHTHLQSLIEVAEVTVSDPPPRE